MNEITQIPSRFGQISGAIAVIDFAVLAILLLVNLLVFSFVSSDFKYTFGTFAVLAFFLFPIIAFIGLIIGGIGFFQPEHEKFYCVLGVILNIFNLLLWVGFVIYQITFNANRFRI
ncbi:MAG TPA: hypothetical protein PKY59_05105 [Pyrinomonadaceae bacterium]|nr:hypothetical protein [Pyrinomonadaceae bacterium]